MIYKFPVYNDLINKDILEIAGDQYLLFIQDTPFFNESEGGMVFYIDAYNIDKDIVEHTLIVRVMEAIKNSSNPEYVNELINRIRSRVEEKYGYSNQLSSVS